MANQKVQLKDGSNNLYPVANFESIDSSNLLAQLNGYGTAAYTAYTATQDCFMFISWNENGKGSNYPKLNDKMFPAIYGTHPQQLRLKKGDKFEFYGNVTYKVSYIVFAAIN